MVSRWYGLTRTQLQSRLDASTSSTRGRIDTGGSLAARVGFGECQPHGLKMLGYRAMYQLWPGFVIAIASSASCGSTSNVTQDTSLPAPQEAPQVRSAADEIAHLAPVNLVDGSVAVPGASPLAEVVRADREPLLACFGPLAGEVTLHLELRPDGGVVGGSSDPAGGQEGVAAVADCVLDRARAWRFPRAHDAGTRIVVVPLAVPETATSSSVER